MKFFVYICSFFVGRFRRSRRRRAVERADVGLARRAAGSCGDAHEGPRNDCGAREREVRNHPDEGIEQRPLGDLPAAAAGPQLTTV